MHRRVHGHLGSKGRAIESNVMTSVKLYYVVRIVKATTMITAGLVWKSSKVSLLSQCNTFIWINCDHVSDAKTTAKLSNIDQKHRVNSDRETSMRTIVACCIISLFD